MAGERRIGLISCVKSKRLQPGPARDLYVSPYFRAMRAYVERSCDEYRILSALHGVVHPAKAIEPYEVTLKGQPTNARRAWAESVVGALTAEFPRGVTFEMHGGRDYTQFIAALLQSHGYDVEEPCPTLPFGMRLSWYQQQDEGPRSARLGPSLARPAPSKTLRPSRSMVIPGGSDFGDALRRLLADAESAGEPHRDVSAGDLHRIVGGYPGPRHRMPSCCAAMQQAIQPRDEILHEPPSGKGASLVIRYRLPRG